MKTDRTSTTMVGALLADTDLDVVLIEGCVCNLLLFIVMLFISINKSIRCPAGSGGRRSPRAGRPPRRVG